MGSIIFRIAEYYKEKYSIGGSSFLVERVAGSYCPVVDNANGSYVGRCPAVEGVGCLPMTIRRQSIFYSLYLIKMNPLDHLIFNELVEIYK